MCYKISFISKSFVMIKVLISEFSKLSLVTAIMALKPVSCYYMTSFNYGGKEARDVGLTCRCHLSNIMPDSIFYDSMGWGITCPLFFFLRVTATVFLSIKEMNSVVLLSKHQ